MANPNESQSSAENREQSVRPASSTAPNSPNGDANQNPNVSRFQRFKHGGEIAGLVLLIGGAFLGVKGWMESQIDKTVEKKLSEPVILRKIAQESRPILIFNADESIVADAGAAQFVKELKITAKSSWEKNVNLPDHIHIEFTKFLQSPPIITPLSQFLGVATPKRGNGLSWEFEFAWGGYTPGQDEEHQIFRLEILP